MTPTDLHESHVSLAKVKRKRKSCFWDAHRWDVKVNKPLTNWQLYWFCSLILKCKTFSLIPVNIYIIQAMQWLQKTTEFTNQYFLRWISKGATCHASQGHLLLHSGWLAKKNFANPEFKSKFGLTNMQTSTRCVLHGPADSSNNTIWWSGCCS